jgi:hypothetical protein
VSELRHQGSAQWSENENPVYGRGLNKTLHSVSDGFKKGRQKDRNGDPTIECKACGVIICD